MLHLSTEKKICDSQTKQKQQHDQHGKERSFSPGQTVWARDFRGSTKWVPGVASSIMYGTAYLRDVVRGQILVEKNFIL